MALFVLLGDVEIRESTCNALEFGVMGLAQMNGRLGSLGHYKAHVRDPAEEDSESILGRGLQIWAYVHSGSLALLEPCM